GDEVSVPRPDFIGSTLDDVAIYRNRLCLIAGDTQWFSQTTNFFNFWPTSTTIVRDDDPFGIVVSASAAAEGRPSRQRFAVPIRKVLFTTADAGQFETSTSSVMTAKQAVNDSTTAYLVDVLCRPVPM